MSNNDAGTPYDRFLHLMDYAQDAIERQDMDAVSALEAPLAQLTAEMDAHLQSAAKNAVHPEDLRCWESPIRTALDRVVVNQIRLSGWIEATSQSLGKLQQGVAAMRGYTAASAPTPVAHYERKG